MLPGRLSGTAKRVNSALKAMCRLHRLGQQTPQKVWILAQVRTFEAYIEDTNILKALPQSAADLDVSEPRSEVGEVHRLACM